MKQKLVSVLLALTVCVGMVVPAFAEETEELPIPEETEVLTSEEVHGHEEVAGEVFSWGIANPNWEEAETEDGVKTIAYVAGPMFMDNFSVAVQATIGNCSGCGKYNWVVVPQGSSNWENDGNASTHNAYFITGYMCQTPGCISVEYRGEWRRESHSLVKNSFTGNHYHKGTLHYLEWEWGCGQCGYTTTKWESRSCPGSPSGEGCIIPVFGVKPPIEVESTDPTEDVVKPEDATELEDVTEPEEVAEPEEIITPEETTEPEEVTEPEEADIPEEVETPAETVEPEEIIAPEESVAPEDSTGPGETVVPEDGESVE